MEIRARNVNTAFSDALWYLTVAGVEEQSRNGPVLVAPEPVLTTYSRPWERVLFSHARDANPYFHLMESLWMLGGRNDVAFVKQFNSRIEQYSDDAVTFHGAYGHRWRKHFGHDQLWLLTEELRTNPETRRAVLSMWDDSVDLRPALCGGLDVPCNTTAYFDLRGGKLNLTVCNRSNDAIWGCYGANAVQFSVLQEYMAAWLNVNIGVYRQFSNNLHVYKNLPAYDKLVPHVDIKDYYEEHDVEPFPMMVPGAAMELWDEDLHMFLEDPLGDAAYRTEFFALVAAPMVASWFDRKTKKNDGRLAATAIKASDWRVACLEWIQRREDAARGK